MNEVSAETEWDFASGMCYSHSIWSLILNAIWVMPWCISFFSKDTTIPTKLTPHALHIPFILVAFVAAAVAVLTFFFLLFSRSNFYMVCIYIPVGRLVILPFWPVATVAWMSISITIRIHIHGIQREWESGRMRTKGDKFRIRSQCTINRWPKLANQTVEEIKNSSLSYFHRRWCTHIRSIMWWMEKKEKKNEQQENVNQ